MQLLINGYEFSNKLQDGILTEQEIFKIEENLNYSGVIVNPVNIGPGADAWVVLLTIKAAVDIFKIGKDICDGIDGWKDLRARIKSLTDKKEIVALDSDAASIVAVNYIFDKIKVKSLVKIQEQETNFIELQELLLDRKKGDFISKPHAFHIKTYNINNEKICILGVSPDGTVEEIKCYELGNPYGMVEVDLGLEF